MPRCSPDGTFDNKRSYKDKVVLFRRRRYEEKSKHAITVRHSTQFDATQVKIDMGLLGENWQQFAGKCERLAAAKPSRKDALKVLIDAMGDPENGVYEGMLPEPGGYLTIASDRFPMAPRLVPLRGIRAHCVN